MIIENPEAFKSWLTTILEPLCDADPAALAKYVFALVKKDKPITDLRESMIDQLDVFLQQETLMFVELLFKTLETQSYLDHKTAVPKSEPVAAPAPAQLSAMPPQCAPTTSQVLTMPLILPTSSSGNISRVLAPTVAGVSSVKKETVEPGMVRSQLKSESEKEDKVGGRSGGRMRHRSPLSPPIRRSRSRSWEHSSSSHRSRGREREREREREHGRTGWRGGGDEERRGRKQSPSRRYGRDRRSSYSRSKSPRRGDGGSRSSSRSPRHGHPRVGGSGRGYRSRSCSPVPPHSSAKGSSLSPRSRSHTPPPQGSGMLHNRSRSRSRSAEHMRDTKKEPLSGAGTPTQDSNHGDVDMRLTTTSQSIQSVVSAAPPPPGVVPTGVASVVPVVTPSQAGVPPGPPPGAAVPGVPTPQQAASVPSLAVDGGGSTAYIPKRRCRDFDEKGYCMRGDLCPYDHGNDPVVLEDVSLSRVLAFGGAAGTRVPPQHPPPLPPNTPPHPPPPPPPPPPVVVGASLSHPPPPQVVGGPHHPRGMMGPHVGGRPHLHHHQSHHSIGGLSHPRGNMEYNPDAPSMEPRMNWGRMQFRGPPPGMRGGMRHTAPRQVGYGGGGGGLSGGVGGAQQQQHAPQRELISVPVSDNAHIHQTHKHTLPENNQQNFTNYKRMRLDNNGPYLTTLEEPETIEMDDVGPSKKKTGFDYSRLGPRKNNPNNCSLELKKVPRGLNNIAHLNNHFAKFGKIVNIQVSHEGDPEAALITFSSHAEANAAYRSTEAVLNNRFIKVFWHNKIINEGKQENVPPPRPSVKERLGSVMMMPNPIKVLNVVQPKATPLAPTAPPSAISLPPQLENEKVIMSGNNLTKTVYIPTALKKPQPEVAAAPVAQENVKAQAAAAIKKSQEILAAREALKKKQEEKRKEALKLTADLRKRKQELVEKQLAQQKILIEKLEKSNAAAAMGGSAANGTNAAGLLKPGEREAIMATVKSLQESIEAIKKDLAVGGPSTNANNVQSHNRKTKEEAQKEILDAELDLFTKQQVGGDTSELQRKVAELKMEAHSLGILSGTSAHPSVAVGLRRGASGLMRLRGRGSLRSRVAVSRGGFRGRGRGHHSHLVLGGQHHLHHAHTSVDHRPTKILVSGYEADDKQDVLAHFAQFGELVDYASDESTPSLVIKYRTRKEAEVALLQGRVFQDRLLSLTWWSEGGSSTGEGNGTEVSPRGQGMRGVGQDGADGEEEEEVEESAEVEEEEDGAVDVLLPDEEEEEEEDGEDRSWRR